MNVTRAQEIIRSADKIVVRYKGDPVWIDDVDEPTAMARVHTERNPGNTLTVNVDQLEEK